jgi:flagellar basal body rod protein FlgB
MGMMIKALFGPLSVPHALRRGLDDEMAAHRAIAGRVSEALSSSSRTDFPGSLEAARRADGEESDLLHDMAALADTQLRYEADAKLLRAAYDRLRNAIR